MSIAQSSDIIQNIVNDLGLSPAAERVPVEVMEQIMPVYVANKRGYTNVLSTGTYRGTTGGAATIYGAPATGRTYLKGAVINLSVEPVDTVVECFIDIQPIDSGRTMLWDIGTANFSASATRDAQIITQYIDLSGSPILLKPLEDIRMVLDTTLGNATSFNATFLIEHIPQK